MDKSQPTIMQILPALNEGGVERGAVEIAKALLKAGYTPLIASKGGKLETEVLRSKANHVKLNLTTKNPLLIYYNALKLAGIIKSNKVDILHARSRAPAWSGLLAARKTNTPFLTTFHGLYAYGNLLKRKYNSVMVSGDIVIAISDFIAEHIKQYYGVAEEKIRIIKRGVDLDYFNHASVNPERIIKLISHWNIPEELPVIFMPGRITRWKGQKLLLESLSMLEDQHYCCVFAGNYNAHPQYYKELKILISKMGIEKNCRFVGNVSDMPAAYSLASIVVCTSTRPEAFGRTAIEAGAMKKLAIASDIGGAKETIMHGKSGFLINPENKSELAETIMKSLKMNDDEIQKIGEAARKNVEQKFSLKFMEEKTLQVYNELLGKKNKS